MKRSKLTQVIASALIILSLQNCIVVTSYGPDGRDGAAFFAVDYHFSRPYSYWDNNPSIPYNPAFGNFYHTYSGLFEFEYFINPEDYWYGTYEIWTNPGGPGHINGEGGWDGLDTYLTLYCDPNGFHQDFFEYKIGAEVIKGENEIVIERKMGTEQFRIVMKQANIKSRPAHEPKFLISESSLVQ